MKRAVVLGLGASATLSLLLAATGAMAETTVRMGTYVWLPTVEGPLGLVPAQPPPVLDDNILDNLQFFGFGVGEVSGDRFGATFDFAYVDLDFGDNVEVLSANPLTPKLSTKAMVGTVNGFYRLHDGETVSVDVTGGVRGFWLETDFTLTGPNGGEIDAGGDTNWVDAVVGARARGQFGRWGLTGQGDVGGGSHTSSWQVQGLVEYDLSSRWRLMGGYRYLHFDNGKRRADVDMDLKGPLFGFTYRF
jgi:opacity protein-like surface antigen